MTKQDPRPVDPPSTVVTTSTVHRPVGWFMRRLPYVTYAGVMTITASSEFEFAQTVLRLDHRIAWALPVVVDSYVLAAFRTGRDVAWAMGVMGGVLVASMGAHLAVSDGGTLHPFGRGVAATVAMIALVIVAWRVHVLIEKGRRPYVPTATPVEATTPDDAAPTTPVALPRDEVPTTVEEPSTPAPATLVAPIDDPPRDDRRRVLAQTEWIVAKLTDDVRHGRRPAPAPADIRAWARDLENPIEIDDPRSRRIRKAINKRLAEHGEHTTTNRQEA